MRTFRLLIAAAAWLSLAFIVFATVVPIGFRPHDPFSVNVDRGLAFAVMAGLFVLAYPRRWRAVLVLNLAGAGAIEALREAREKEADALVRAEYAAEDGG